MKKLVAMILALCMLASLGTAFAEEDNSAYEPAVKETVAKFDDNVSLDVFTERLTSVEDLNTNKMTYYYQQYTGVTANWTQVEAAELETQFNISITSGDYPDIYAMAMDTSQVIEYGINEGIFIALDDLIEEYAPNVKRILEENPSLKKAITAPDGHIYTLFRTDTGVHYLSKYKMFVNKDWLAQYVEVAGKEPETVEDFEAMLTYFKENDMNGNGDASDEIPYVSSSSGWGADPYFWFINPYQIVGFDKNYMVLDADGKVYDASTTDGFREGIAWMNKLYETGLFSEATYTQDADTMKNMLNVTSKDQQVVGCFTAVHQGVFTSTVNKDTDEEINWSAEYVPLAPVSGPDGVRRATTRDNGGSDITNIFLQCAITSACEDPVTAIKWLDASLDPVYGKCIQICAFEGVDYYYDDNLVSMLGTSPARVTIPGDGSDVQNISWGNHIMPIFATVENNYDTYAEEGSTNANLYAAHEKYQPYYVSTGIPIFTWPTSAEDSTEMSEIKTLTTDYVASSIAEFVLGRTDIDDDAAWGAYKAEIDNMGIARYIELYQAMLDQ